MRQPDPRIEPMMIRPSNFPSLRSAWFILAVWLLLAWGRTACAQSQMSLEPAVVLSGRSEDNQRPTVAASEDGRYVVATWDGMVEGTRRILLRENVDGVWLPERIVDAEPLADNRSPVAAVDSSGNIHVAWLGQVRDSAKVFYASITAGRLINWGVLGATGQEDEGNCSKLVLRLDEAGQPWLAWEAGRGTRVSIHCARIENGVFVTDNLTPGAQNHNWFPDIFFRPEPVVVWYADQIPEFAIRAASFDLRQKAWSPMVLEGLDQIPKNSLPQLSRRASGEFVACWVEDLSEEGSVRTDYVLISEQGDGADSRPRPVEFETFGTKESLARTVVGEKLALAWCSKSLEQGWQIHLISGAQVPFPIKIQLTDGDARGYYDHPAVASLPDGIAAVWHSSESFGGDGRVFFRRARF